MKKIYRVKKERDFQTVFTNSNSVANRRFVVYILDKPEQVHFRVGISVGKKIGNAVTRNAVKRKIRSALSHYEDQLRDDVDFIVIARPGVQQLSYADVCSNLLHVLKLAKLIK